VGERERTVALQDPGLFIGRFAVLRQLNEARRFVEFHRHMYQIAFVFKERPESDVSRILFPPKRGRLFV
jgi:hypothetical protein